MYQFFKKLYTLNNTVNLCCGVHRMNAVMKMEWPRSIGSSYKFSHKFKKNPLVISTKLNNPLHFTALQTRHCTTLTHCSSAQNCKFFWQYIHGTLILHNMMLNQQPPHSGLTSTHCAHDDEICFLLN